MEKLIRKLFNKEIILLVTLLTILIWVIAPVTPSNAFTTNTEKSINIAINADGFDPEISTITVGTTVIWTNNLAVPVALDSGEIFQILLPLITDAQTISRDGEPGGTNSKAYVMRNGWMPDLELAPNESFSYTFTDMGEYRIKAGMNSGAVIYVDASILEPEPEATTTVVSTGEPSATAEPVATKEPIATASPTPVSTSIPTNTPTPTVVPTESNNGQLNIALNTNPADGLDFEFTVNDEPSFKLDDASTDDKDGIGQEVSFTELEPGQLTIAVAYQENYLIGSIDCTSSLSDADITISELTIEANLRNGEQLNCQYTFLKDSDNDRLADVFETNNGDFINSTSTGTDPNNADTDADGISDGDEALGTESGLDLPSMGANPLRKTILIEYDWFDDSLKNKGYCGNDEHGFHSHRPTESMVVRVRDVYAQAPNINPDGSTGIDFIQDYGQGGVFTGGNLVAKNQSGLITGSVYGSEFTSLKAENFSSNRRGYFHYAILAHQYGSASNFSSGQAEVSGDDLIVSVYNYHCSDDITGNTVIHELGHNLGLLHGGDDHLNNKPNYNSVMNYRFQFSGIDANESCDGWGDGISGYSRGDRISLNENSLNEEHGVCGAEHTGFDWNNDGDMHDHGVAQNINSDSSMSVLNDHNDWENLYYFGILSEVNGRSVQLDHIRPVSISSEQEIPSMDQGSAIKTNRVPAQLFSVKPY
ncbi:MAG: hypothetical protein AB8G95_30415 [Anaerolineae bacterium]